MQKGAPEDALLQCTPGGGAPWHPSAYGRDYAGVGPRTAVQLSFVCRPVFRLKVG
jgi:hypothetical protein